MTIMLDDIAAYVANRPAPRSPDTRAAISYLVASGATAISIAKAEFDCVFRIGIRIDQDAAMVLPEPRAKGVANRARKLPGASPGIDAENLRARGGLNEFTKTYRKHRLAALGGS
jgi:hypothetical protein